MGERQEGPRMRRWLVWGGSWILAVLAGCSTLTVSSDPTKTPPRPDEAVTVVSVTGNTAQVSQFDSILLRRLPDPGSTSNVQHTYLLHHRSPGLSRDTSLFLGTLPQGEYEFVRFNDDDTQQFLPLGEKSRETLGRFRVEGGSTVDLGRLIVTPLNTRVLVGRSARITGNEALVQRFLPEHSKFFAGGVKPGWLSPTASRERVEEYALSRPVGANGLTLLKDGRVAAGSRLGTVLLRDTSGSWSAAQAPGLESILYVTAVDRPDASLLAVGEFGTLLKLDVSGTRLSPVDTGDLPPGNLFFISGHDTTGWFIAQQRGSEVTLYRSDRLESGRWTPVRREDVSFSFWHGANRFWIWETTEGFAYATSQGAMHFYRRADASWTSRTVPGDARLITVVPSPGDRLGIVTSPGGGFGGVFASVYVTRDGASTWEPVQSEFKVKVNAPRILPDGTMLLAGGVFSKSELHVSKDQGKTWTPSGEFALTQDLVVLADGSLYAIDGNHGFSLFSIRRSTDLGATWATEYTIFDRQAYEAQQGRK